MRTVGELRCAVDVPELLAALRRTRPRRLELFTCTPAQLAVRLTSAYGTGIELPLSVRARRIEGGSHLQVAPARSTEESLASAAASAWLDVLKTELPGPVPGAQRPW